MPTDSEFVERIVGSVGSYIESLSLTAVMIYPSIEDMESRREYHYKALICFLAEQARYASSVGLNPVETNKALLFFFSIAQAEIGGLVDLDKYLLIQRKEDFRQSFNEHLCKGILTGLTLRIALTQRISLNKAIDVCVKLEREAGNIKPDGTFRVCGVSMKLTESNFNKNIWHLYKKAAHLWAAFWHFRPIETPYVPQGFIDFDQMEVTELPSILQDKQFPSNYDLFKSLAYLYWDNAISYRPKKSGGTLLNENGPCNPRDLFGDISTL